MGRARLDFARMREVGFWKLCGSGSGEGFRPKPNTAVWAILATWPDEVRARAMLAQAPVYKRWRERATESCDILLSTTSARGAWSGRAPFEVTAEKTAGPIAVLTRATLKPRALVQFWRKVPAIEAMITDNDALLFKIGIGEVPMVHQVTFSIWRDRASMHRFAHESGAHHDAVRAVRQGDWFAEELYAQFKVLDTVGTWQGRPPLPEEEERERQHA